LTFNPRSASKKETAALPHEEGLFCWLALLRPMHSAWQYPRIDPMRFPGTDLWPLN